MRISFSPPRELLEMLAGQKWLVAESDSLPFWGKTKKTGKTHTHTLEMNQAKQKTEYAEQFLADRTTPWHINKMFQTILSPFRWEFLLETGII